eukprot:gene4759-34509_t
MGCLVQPSQLRLGVILAWLLHSLMHMQALASSGIACERSGMCSLGQVSPWSGDIYTGEKFREALLARSYKKELIIMVTSSNQMLMVTQALMNLRRLGLEHVLLLSTNKKECQAVNHRLSDYGCAYDRFQLPMVGPDIGGSVGACPMWHTRWRTLARAVRMGYNVLCSDTDVVFFHDPYAFFKSPPFSNYTIINQAETLYDITGYRDNESPNVIALWRGFLRLGWGLTATSRMC